MALITIPTIKAAAVVVKLIRKDTYLETLGGNNIVVAPPGARWMVSFPIVSTNILGSRAWFAALVQISKLENTFFVPVPGHPVGSGYTGANPLVAGASQTGTSLACDGAGISTTVGLAGDYIDVNDEFKMLTEDAISDGAGLVTLNFEPALRSSPADNKVVDVKAPKMLCQMATSEAVWQGVIPNRYNISINAVEAF